MRKTKLLSLLALLLTAVTQGTWAQSNLLDGVFSVSASKKVSFAQGNLQATYNGSNWSWAFAEHQWDYIGNAAGNTKVTASSPYISENATVDLFGWVGASSTWTGENKYGITSSSATNNKNGYGNVASESLKSDWGALIGLGWRTLSMAEWTYLLSTRTVNGGKGAGKSYTLNQSVNGKKGMVIYPDNYTGAVYSGSNWASFEAAGCVFLPAAGWRNGTTIQNINDRGFYWSSTPANTTDAKRMFFAGGLDLIDSNSRAYGFSVRLVKEYSLSTDATGDFIIASKADWEKFCSDINNGSTYSGQTVKLTADISGITTRTSNDAKNPFCGTFDGQGHTLNLNINVTTSDQTSAPFGYIENATVKNLHITGSETTAGLRPASIAGFAKNSTITNCKSSVALTSSRNADIDCGAIVARTEKGSTVTLNGCLFTGSITYSNAAGYEGGGMVGWAKGTVKLNDCVFAPSAITITKYQSHNMFIGNASGTLTNCYYNDVAAASSLTVQGKQARNIIAGDGVIINGLGAVTTTYAVSGIAVYGKGLKYGDTFCAGNSESVTLDLNFSKTGCVFTSYTASGGTLANPTSNGPTLTMPNAVVTIGATYRECAGTEADPYLITSTADWNTLSANVDNGNTYSGVYFSQTEDISVTTTLGPSTTNNSYKPFGGIYDGNGKTLDVTLNGSGQCTAPFGCIQGATIKNLHITGSISTTGLRPASIASFCENSTITNCWSEVAISSSNGSDIDGGAFVGRVNENKSLTLNGCLFTGSITYSNANGFEGGGMVGYTQTGSSATLNNCVFAPSVISIKKYSGHNMFVGGKVLGTLTNCYYNDVAAASSLTKQAKQMRSITAGTDVTSLVISGDGTEYDVSAITAYATGLKYNDVYYAGSADNVSLTLSHGDAATGYSFDQYTASAGTLCGTTLTMPDADVTISATWTKNTKTLAETATDNQAWLTENDGQVYEITLTRTLQAGSYNTFAVPFNISSEKMAAMGITAKKLTASEFNSTTGTLSLTFSSASEIEAGKPYLVKVSANVENPVFNGVTISSTAVPNTETTAVNFVPTLGATTLVGDVKSILFLGAENKLINPSAENSSMKGFRAYFQLKGDAATARAFNINFEDGETTGIESVTPDSCPKREESIYTLDGRRVVGQPKMRSAEGRLYPQGLKKGIYVVSGKKVIIK